MASKPKTTAKKAAKKLTNGSAKKPRESKTAIVAALLLRKSGCTRADILEVTGWKAVSVQQMAEAANLKLRIEKIEGKRGLTYFGKKTGAAT